MSIFLASDHAGFKLKELLKKYLDKQKFIYKDLGTHSDERVDYPDITILLVKKVLEDTTNKGILICGSGLGVTISANRFKNIRACLCNNSYLAKMARKHNDSNVLTLGARIIGEDLAVDILATWLNTNFESGRHLSRINKIETNLD